MVSFMRYINRIARCSDQYRNDSLNLDNLAGYQHTYILNICRNPGISQEKLAKLIYINKSNVTRQAAILEQNGYIERRTSECDKRVIKLYPTALAEEVYPKILDVLHEWNDFLTEDFTEAETEVLQKLLERMMDKAITYIESEKHNNI